MRAWLAPIAALTTAVNVAVASPASAGIDEPYFKPADEKTWGEILADFVGYRGFSKSYALVIGISKFDSFDPLPTAKDPLRMRDYLIQEAGFDYVHVLTDEKATKGRIAELMVDVLPNMVDANDRLLFYWSGHGTQRKVGEREFGYLPLTNSSSDRFSTMVSMNDVQRWDRLLQAEQALFLLDACFSGLAGSAPQSDLRGAKIQQLAKPAHHLITAGTGNERTIAGASWGGSIFTHAILRAVRGTADAETEDYEPDGVVSLSELLDYVRTRVDDERREAGWEKAITPQRRDLRTSEGEFFFLTNERKVAMLENQGAHYQGRFEHGVPVVVMGRREEEKQPEATCDREADRLFWRAIENETAPEFFEAYLKRFENGEICGLFSDLARLKLRASSRKASGPLEPGPRRIREVQEMLTTLGFDPGPADGVLGPKTRAAIMAFQRSVNAGVTGTLSTEDELALAQAYSRSATAPASGDALGGFQARGPNEAAADEAPTIPSPPVEAGGSPEADDEPTSRRSWLGVNIQSITEELADSLGLDEAKGALIASVTPGGPAEAADIQSGDVILEFDQKKIDRMRDLPRIVAETPSGKEVEVDIWRNGERQSVRVTLGDFIANESADLEKEVAAITNTGADTPTTTPIEPFGMTVATITDELRQRFELSPDAEGVVIVEVAEDSEAATQGLRAGDVIAGVAQEDVNSISEVLAKVKQAHKEDKRSLLFLISRQGDARFVALALRAN